VPTTRTVLPIEQYLEADYNELARNPNNHIGDPIRVFGEVVQLIDDGSGTIFMRVAQGSDYDKMWLVRYTYLPSQSRILENDLVLVGGRYQGITTYESALSGTIALPYLDGDMAAGGPRK